MHKITAIIPCRNEAPNMDAVIQSVSWCDEILVVDSFSTDDTLVIAGKYPVKILQREYVNSASQKNWAIPQAANEWILLVDADERVPEELKNEIQSLLATNEIGFDAFIIGRRNFFLGREIKHSGWGRDKVTRLFKRDTCRYEEKNVHAEILTSGKTGRLKNKLLHYTYRDMQHYMEKWERYATWGAEEALKKNVRPNFFHFICKPAWRFFKHYIIDLGFLDGYPGFIVSSLSAKGVFLRYVKLYAMQKKEK